MIAVDAMGGDLAPNAVVEGAFYAALQNIPILLFGNEKSIISKLNSLDPNWQRLPIEIRHCSQTIAMHDNPTRVVMRKQDASLIKAAESVVTGNTQALVSAGNSGAVLVASVLIIGRSRGIGRPAVGGFLPTQTSSIFCLDLGVNTDCKPEFLTQFAHMGHAYVRLVKNIAKPRIALLSNGHEAYKGSTVVRQTFALLQESSLNFVGNLEARDVFDDQADVLVCDGFVGNVLLKGAQGLGRVLFSWLEQEARRSLIRKMMISLALPVLKTVKSRIDYKQAGGALLLGVRHPVILAHGCSDAQAMKNAIKFAYKIVQEQTVSLFNKEVESLLTQDHQSGNQGLKEHQKFQHVSSL